MCGIVGIHNFRKRGVDKALLKSMADAISYRGPDQEGYYTDSHAGLGHKRLSIIDLSEKGRQPMCNEDGTIWLVFNGEIYNFQELRKALGKKHRFASNTDSEAIIHGYEEYGDDVVNKLSGMFAFAIYDQEKKKLLLARDRTGKKPLFYYHDKERIVFASELKAIIQDETIPREISDEAVSHYITYGCIPAPLSIFRNIKKLLPGNYLVAEKGKVKIKQYWSINFRPEKNSEEYYCENILELLEDATKSRLIADVPLGAFLSGGIDSSAVVAMMARHSDEVKTFSIGFEEEEFSELKYARLVSERFRTDHKEFIVKPDAVKILPKLIWLYNEPYADSSALPSYYVAEMTRKHVTVALNGDGGDESFAGYGRFFMDRYADIYKKFPVLVKKGINGLVNVNLPGMAQLSIVKRLNELGRIESMNPDRRFVELSSVFNDDEKEKICDPKLMNFNSEKIMLDEMKKGDALARKLNAGIKIYLANDLNVKMDIATMAHALETRSPFLDHRMLELAAKMPSSIKMKGNERKYILKKALKDTIPDEILYKRKQGFSVPLDRWFRGELKQLAQNVLHDKKTFARGYLKENEVRKLLDNHASKRADNGHKLWLLLCLELWHRMYMDRKKPEFSLNKIL